MKMSTRQKRIFYSDQSLDYLFLGKLTKDNKQQNFKPTAQFKAHFDAGEIEILYKNDTSLFLNF